MNPSVLTLVAGWAAVMLGVLLVPLPGPGTLVAVAGLRLLVPHHAWAARVYEPTRDRAVRAAAAGVATWPRVALAAVGPVGVLAVAAAYAVEPDVLDLPFAGVATTAGLLVSGLAAAALVAVSVVRWGPSQNREPREALAVPEDDLSAIVLVPNTPLG